MIVALIVTIHVLGLATAWGARRHRATRAWDRELAAAFAVSERREMPTRRVL